MSVKHRHLTPQPSTGLTKLFSVRKRHQEKAAEEEVDDQTGIQDQSRVVWMLFGSRTELAEADSCHVRIYVQPPHDLEGVYTISPTSSS